MFIELSRTPLGERVDLSLKRLEWIVVIGYARVYGARTSSVVSASPMHHNGHLASPSNNVVKPLLEHGLLLLEYMDTSSKLSHETRGRPSSGALRCSSLTLLQAVQPPRVIVNCLPCFPEPRAVSFLHLLSSGNREDVFLLMPVQQLFQPPHFLPRVLFDTGSPHPQLLVQTFHAPRKCSHLLQNTANATLEIGEPLSADIWSHLKLVLHAPLDHLELPIHASPLALSLSV
jgi:hypothetical protein